MKHFKKSLTIGNIGQKFFTDILDYNNQKYELSNSIDYDIKVIQEPCLTFECKYDIYCERSGNVAIEIWNTRKDTPSGLTATKAIFWVHILSRDEIWIQRVDVIKKLIDTLPPLKIVEGGDNNSKMILYKKLDFIDKYFLKINKKDYQNVILTLLQKEK